MADNIKQRLRLINAIGAAGAVTVLASTMVFGVVPMYRDGNHHIHESINLQNQITQLDNLNLKLARVEVEKSTREARLADVESRLPNSNAMNQFVQDLAKVAEEAGLQVDTVVPAKDLKETGGYKQMTVSISGTGDWDTCYRFLTGLRGPNRKLTRLDSLTLDTDKEKTSDKPVCRILVDISTFIAR